MLILLFTVLGLAVWSLRLMAIAFRQRDFSFLFAGTLVAVSAAGIVVVYSLMTGCMGYLSTDDSVWITSSAGVSSEFKVETNQDLSFNGGTLWVEEIPGRG